MFQPEFVELRGDFTLPTPPEDAFPLFSPEGERDWVPGWDPELLHPPGATWERGLLFRTQEERGEAVWIVTALDRRERRVEYHRVESGRYVARIRVACDVADGGGTRVGVSYGFVGLSDVGNRDIAGMSDAAFADKLGRWESWIRARLARD